MRDSRAQIIAALQSASSGGQNFETIASATLLRAGCGPGVEPSYIAIGMGYDFRILTVGPMRGFVDGRTICAVWDRDQREWWLNILIGVARAVRTEQPDLAAADVFRLAGHLAMPGLDRMDIGPPASHIPVWFVQAHRRRMSGGYGSGVWQAQSRSTIAR